ARAVSLAHAPTGSGRRVGARRRTPRSRARAAGDAGAQAELAGGRGRRADGDRGRRGTGGGRARVIGLPARSSRRPQCHGRGRLRSGVSGAAPGPSWRRSLRRRPPAGARHRRGRRRPAGDPGLPGEGRSREAAVRGSDGDRRLRHQRGCPRQAGRDRRDPRWPARFRERALMRRMFDTIRSRIVAGLIPLAIGLVGTALLAAVTLRQMRYAVAEELAESAAVRPQAAEVTRLVRDLATRQAVKAAQVADRLAAASREREKELWLLLGGIAVVGLFLARWAMLSIHGPLSRLVTAAERFGSGDLRPVTVGEMPREFRVLADAMQRMADRLRRIVGEVVGESDRIAGSAGDLSATSEQLAASSS